MYNALLKNPLSVPLVIGIDEWEELSQTSKNPLWVTWKWSYAGGKKILEVSKLPHNFNFITMALDCLTSVAVNTK